MRVARKCRPIRGMRSTHFSSVRSRRPLRSLLQNPLEQQIPLVSTIIAEALRRHTGRILHADADGDVRQHHASPGSQSESQLSGNQAKGHFRFRGEELVSKGRRLPRRPNSFAALELKSNLRRRLA